MNKAFTLIELLIVISIIGLLSTVVGVNYIESQKRSRDGARIASITSLTSAIEAFYAAQQRFPGVTPAVSPIIPDSPCIHTTVFTDNKTYPAYYYANQNCNPSGFADGYWIPGIERYLATSPKELRPELAALSGQFVDPLLAKDPNGAPNTVRTYVYRPLAGGYLAYARLEAEQPDAVRSVKGLTRTNPNLPLSGTELDELQNTTNYSLFVIKR